MLIVIVYSVDFLISHPAPLPSHTFARHHLAVIAVSAITLSAYTVFASFAYYCLLWPVADTACISREHHPWSFYSPALLLSRLLLFFSNHYCFFFLQHAADVLPRTDRPAPQYRLPCRVAAFLSLEADLIITRIPPVLHHCPPIVLSRLYLGLCFPFLPLSLSVSRLLCVFCPHPYRSM